MMTNPVPAEERDYLLSGRSYRALTWLVLILFPLFGLVYFILSEALDFPEYDEIVALFAGVDLVCGIALKIAKTSYHKSLAKYDGVMIIDDSDDETKVYRMEMHSAVEDLDKKEFVVFKVNVQ
jgi:hypothetical protein